MTAVGRDQAQAGFGLLLGSTSEPTRWRSCKCEQIPPSG